MLRVLHGYLFCIITLQMAATLSEEMYYNKLRTVTAIAEADIILI